MQERFASLVTSPPFRTYIMALVSCTESYIPKVPTLEPQSRQLAG